MNKMSELPVNKWNLQFLSEDLEARYQRSLTTSQLFFHQTMMTCATIACVICLIVFVAQSQPLVIILQMAVSLIIVFTQLMISKYLLKYIQTIYALNYVGCIVVGQYISYLGTNMQEFLLIRSQYILGHAYCLLIICCLRFCNNKIKGLLQIGTPIAILLSQDAFKLENLYLILYFLQGSICLVFIIYQIEYQARAAFFHSVTSSLYIELLEQFTSDGLFALSFDDRSQQFILEFHNQSIIKYLDITNEVQRKNLLRNSFVVDLQSSDVQIKKNDLNRQSLEDYLFQKIKYDVNFLFENISIIKEEKNNAKVFQIKLKLIHLDRKIILISFRNNQTNDLIEQQKLISHNYSQIILNQSMQLSQLQGSFTKQLNQLTVNHQQRQLCFNLMCINLQIRNILNNHLVFFQQDKILKIAQDTKTWKLNTFIETLHHFFFNQARLNSKRFQLINQLPKSFTSKINYKILQQILINVFDNALKDTITGSTILLTINANTNLNPLKMHTKASSEGFTRPEDLSSQNLITNAQFLIKFSFSYNCMDQILEIEKESILNNNERNPDTIISTSVTNVLLGKIGPYKSIIQNKSYQVGSMCNCVVKDCFIYADQIQLDLSFINQSVLI